MLVGNDKVRVDTALHGLGNSTTEHSYRLLKIFGFYFHTALSIDQTAQSPLRMYKAPLKTFSSLSA
jgi:hypothetical protein